MPRFQSILLPVAEAEALVEPFRQTGDWSSAHGVPAHITIAGPWPLSVNLPPTALQRAQTAIRGARYTLSALGNLGDAICLFPENDQPLLDCRAGLLEAVGTADDLDEGWRLHLTLSRGPDSEGGGAIKQAIEAKLPLRCEARELLIARMLGDSEVSLTTL